MIAQVLESATEIAPSIEVEVKHQHFQWATQNHDHAYSVMQDDLIVLGSLQARFQKASGTEKAALADEIALKIKSLAKLYTNLVGEIVTTYCQPASF